MATHTLRSLIEELQNVAKDCPERLNEPVYIFSTVSEEREALPSKGCVDTHIDGYFDLNTETIYQEKEEAQEDPLSDIPEREETTRKSLESWLRKKFLKWIKLPAVSNVDHKPAIKECYVFLMPPKNHSSVEATNNRCYINTSTDLWVIPDMTEREYDVLFAKYGYNSPEAEG